MTNDEIKKILLDIADTKIDFTVTMTGKKSKKVNGLYYPATHEILLHNKNFRNDNELIYTAIHEYAHHKESEELLNLMGVESIYNAKSHTQKFWARFNDLLVAAEKKGYYKLDLSLSPDLEALTKRLKEDYLAKNGALMKEFGELLLKAQKLCTEAGIRYEDYIDRVLQLPRQSEKDLRKVAVMPVPTNIGYDNMKTLSKIDDDEKRTAAAADFAAGSAPVSVRQRLLGVIKKDKDDEEEGRDKLSKLHSEKARIERAIENLEDRLKIIDDAIGKLE